MTLVGLNLPGNLTKHMKSKTHHKRCYELGIVPVPTDVTDEHIDREALAKQVALAKQSHILGMGDDSTMDDDEDEDEEEEDVEGSLDASLDASIEQDVEEEGPVEQNMEEVIVIDKSGDIIQTINPEYVNLIISAYSYLQVGRFPTDIIVFISGRNLRCTTSNS